MSAPSFPSFQPSFESFPDLDENTPSKSHLESQPSTSGHRNKDRRERVGDRDEQRAGTHNRDVKRYRKSEKQARNGGKRSQSRSNDGRRSSHRQKQKKGTQLLDTAPSTKHHLPSTAESRLFFYDRVGDNLNVRLGGLHAGDISVYRPVAGGKKVLGLDKRFSVLKHEGKSVIVGLPEWNSKASELTDRRARSLLTLKPHLLKPLENNSIRYEEADGFIRLPTRKGNENDQNYRSITRGSERDSESELHSSSDSESSDENDLDISSMTAREEGIRDLERRLRESPDSVEDWLHLLDMSVRGMQEEAKSSGKAYTEIAISVLSRALDAHPGNKRSPILRWKLLKAGENIWDKTKLNNEWEKALTATNSPDLYVEWLDWQVRSCATFKSVISSSTRALEFVGKMHTGEEADLARLRIFWRTIIFIRQAGYPERAFSALQAQAELVFNIPEECISLSIEKQLDFLEEFWDSEAPRIGEKNAKGWKAWKSTEVQSGDHDIETYRINEYDGEDAFDMWHFIESHSDSLLIYSARASDLDAEDPYSTVLFSDVRPFLFPLQSERGQKILRMVFLSFLGVHIPGLSLSLSDFALNSDDRWADAALMRSAFVEDLFPRKSAQRMLIADSVNGVTIGKEKSYNSGFDLVQSWALDSLDYLESFSLRSLRIKDNRSPWDQQTTLKEKTEDDAARAFLEQTGGTSDMNWILQGLAFWAVNELRDSALKYSQQLLAKDSSSPELLAAHAYMERAAERFDKARKVYQVALSSLKQSRSSSLVHIWWGAAELEWLLSKTTRALSLILEAADQPVEPSGLNILRAKKRLEERVQISASDWRVCLKWIKLRILLELLTGTLDAALALGNRLLAVQTEGHLRHESLTMALLLLIYDHTITLRNHAPPSLLQGLVHRSFDVYPSNSLVLGLFLECEKGQAVWGRVRELLAAKSQDSMNEKTVSRRIMDVWIANWENGRWIGELERTRAGLEAAVSCDRTRGSPIIWKIFVKLELAAGDLKRAKSVLYRAIGACPLVKELYLLAFEKEFRKVFTSRELMSLAETMAERGLRLRDSLGELMENYGNISGEEEESETEAGSENEMEYDSRELRRLMPL